MREILSLFYTCILSYARQCKYLLSGKASTDYQFSCRKRALSSFSISRVLLVFAVITLSQYPTGLFAQMDSCNVFLQGKYIEVGINVNGAYGSSIDAPTGYHPKGPANEYNTCYSKCTNGRNLGFVADPDKDGWTTGTPNYFGDYFLPGYPQEGWSIEVNGVQANAWNNGGGCVSIAGYPFSTTTLTGSNTTYTSSGAKRIGIWKGSYDSLSITQTTSLDTSTVYFTVYVKIVNTGKVTRNKIYYLRTVDPDNDEPETGTGGFTTKNNIDYKLPNSLNATLVSATSTTYSRCYLGLGTLDCRAKSFINKDLLGLEPTAGDLDSMYNGFGGKGDTVDYIYSGSFTDDVAISLDFKLGNLAPGDSLNFAYTYILNKNDLTAALASTAPQMTVDSTPHISGDTISICRNHTSKIDILNGDGFTWSWTSLTGDTITPTTGTSVTVKIDSASTAYIRAVGTSACSNDTFIIKLSSPARITIDSVSPICTSGSRVLKAHGGTGYSWSPSTGLSCTSCDSPTASPSTTTTYKVTGTNAGGCADSAYVTVTVGSLANVNAGPDRSICKGSSTTLSVTGATSYSWSPSTGLSCSSCTSPTASPTTTTTYIVTGTSGVCTGKDTITVNVNLLPAINAGADKTICKGSSTTLTATGGTSYSWSPTTGLSCSNCASPTASPSTTTSYIVTGTDSNSCSNNDTVKVTVNPLPTVNAGLDKTICIGSSTNLTATGAGSYSWSPTTGLSCSTCASPTASPTTNTTYIVTGTDANGCANSDTVNVTVNPLPTVSAGTDKTICNGSSTTLTATGASSYSWLPTTGLSCGNCASPTASPTSNTTYIVSGTDANGCSNKDTVAVNVNPLPAVNAGADKNICIGGSTTLTAIGAGSYTWSPSTGLSCGTCASPTASPTSTTTYVVTGTDSNGCAKADTVLVTVHFLPSVNAGADRSVCVGSSVNLLVTGASTYTWSPTTGLSCSSCSNPTASPTSTTRYVVTGTDANGCVNVDTVNVTVNSLPTVNAGPDKAICRGSSTTLSATGASSYTWSPTTGLSCSSCTSPTASPTITTNYVVTGTDANGCSNTDTVNVKVNGLPTVTGTGGTICLGDSVTISASGASSYDWSPSTGLSCTTCANPKASPTSTTSYYIITGVDSNGCSNSDTITVIVNPLPTVSAGADKNLCIGSSLSLTATGASTYSWGPSTGLSCTGCSNPTASPTSTTTYVVTGTDAKGCKNKDTVVVNIKPLPAVSAGSDEIICTGNSVSLRATGASSYSWSPTTGLSCSSCASPSATPTATTNYVVTGTDSNGCRNVDTVNIKVNPLPIVNAGADKKICIGSSANLNATGASSYMWSPSTGLSCTNCANPTSSATSTTTYIVMGTDTNSCSNKDTVIVKVNPLPAVNAGPDKYVCFGSSVSLSVTGASSYTWSPTKGLSCSNCSNPVVTTDTPITYKVIGVDVNGCVDSDVVNINVNALPLVSAIPQQAICKGASVKLWVAGAKNYNWMTTYALSCTKCDTTVATPAVTTTYIVSGTDTNGCSDTTHVVVKVNPLPVIKLNNDTALCQGVSLNLHATGAIKYTWSPPVGLSCDSCSDPTASPTNNITYTVVGTDSLGCIDSNKMTITFINKVNVSVGAGDTICQGQTAQLYANGGTSYLWMPSAGLDNNTISNPNARPDSTTIYSVIIKQGNCYTDTEQVLVVVYPIPTVSVSGDQNIFIGEKSHLFATGDNILYYHWSPAYDLSCVDCASPVATPGKTTKYIVIVTGEGGCKAEGDITINVKCDNSHVFIPNTFTPNGDGLNDRFYPSGTGISIIKSMIIYNRWGEKMYEADNIPLDAPQYGWDGTYKGQALKPDVYVYMMIAACESGEEIQIKGDISLVR
jgi:gliding motility-associated-like protein